LLTVDANLVVDFALKVGRASESVIVNAPVSRVETQTGAVSSVVTWEQLHNLPLNGRNFEQLISLESGVSGVSPILSQSTTGTPTNPIYGNQNNYSVSSSHPAGAAVLFDNTDISDFFSHAKGSGVAGASLGVDAIAEVQVLTDTYSPQFGGTGAAVNVASRSGTNKFHGSAYEFVRNNAIDSRCHPYEIANKPIARPASQYFNPACYALQALGTEGNVRRNSIYGPGVFNVDSSIKKRTKITENLDSEFRSEFFHLSRANFGQPNQFVFTGPTAGQITSLATPPDQFAIKLLF
jgi:hypothetical protein